MTFARQRSYSQNLNPFSRRQTMTDKTDHRERFAGLCRSLCVIVLAVSAGTAAAGPKAYVGNFKDNTVSVVDTTSRQVSAVIPVAAGPHGMGIAPDGSRVYVSGDASTSVSVIDTRNDRVAGVIEVGQGPHGVALTPDGRTLLVAVNGVDRVAVIDTGSQSVVATVRVAKPHTIAIRHDALVAYVSSQEPGHFALAVIDIKKHAVIRNIPLDKPPRDLEFGADGKYLYFTLAGVNAVQVLDPATDRVVTIIPTGASPHYANLFKNAAYGLVVVQGPGELLLFDPVSNQPLRSIAVGKQPHWVATSSDGKMAYVPNEGSNDLSVVDLASGKTSTIPLGNAPRKVVVQPSATEATVSISNFAFAPAMISIKAGESVTWRNDDGATHALVFTDGSPGTPSLEPGKRFNRTFERPGHYDYICAFHSYMTGGVEVSP
jgi:YVTN family beta-propeller protein